MIRPRGIQVTLELLGPRAEPRSSLPLLATGLTERDSSHQRCPGISPAVGMGMMTIVVGDERQQASLEIRHRVEVAPFQEASPQHAEPQLDLVEPRAMCRSEMKHMLVSRVRQEASSLPARTQ